MQTTPDRGRPGRFSSSFDASPRAVTVQATPDGIEVRDEMGLLVAAWKTADLRADGSLSGGGVRLRCAAEPGARLEVADAVFLRDKSAATPPPRRRWWSSSLAQMAALTALGLAVVSVPFLLRPADMVPHGPAKPSLQSSYCRGPAGEAALAGLAARLTEGLPADRRPTRVAVVDSPAHEIATVNGVVMLPSEMLHSASGPDELANALAAALNPDAPAVLLRRAGIGADRPPALRDAEWAALLGICR